MLQRLLQTTGLEVFVAVSQLKSACHWAGAEPVRPQSH